MCPLEFIGYLALHLVAKTKTKRARENHKRNHAVLSVITFWSLDREFSRFEPCNCHACHVWTTSRRYAGVNTLRPMVPPPSSDAVGRGIHSQASVADRPIDMRSIRKPRRIRDIVYADPCDAEPKASDSGDREYRLIRDIRAQGCLAVKRVLPPL